MGIGINFAGAPISRTYSEDIALSTSHSIVKNTTSTNTVECNFVPDAYAIAVYQFWVQSDDGLSIVKTSKYLCRYNENAMTAPLCPYSACVTDAEHF